MHASKTIKSFCAGLVLVTSLFLWNPLQVSAYSQSGGGFGMGGGGTAGLSGKVVETMDSGGYTYALVDKNGIKTWVALPLTKIVVGGDIACQPGTVMNNFNSTSLKRSFESIVFSPGLASAGSALAPATASGAVSASAPTKAIQVVKAEGVNAYTIDEIFQKKARLVNQPVAVRGKVVKVSRGIMGKNWLHLQDGTGSAATKTNDLVVTTDSVPEVGDAVTIKGNLSLDRDFGSGYRYDVIIEGAEVTANK